MPAVRGVEKLVVSDVLGELLAAPVFWYARGAADAGRYCVGMIRDRWLALGVGVWIRNLFVPMFGSRDITGVLISFFMRLFQIIVRGLAMAAWTLIVAALFVLYLAVPVFVLFQIFRQVAGLFS